MAYPAKKLFLAVFCLIAVFAAIFLNPSKTQADTQNSCGFDADLKQLSEIKQSTSLAYIEKVRAELNVRKNILNKIINCALTETQILEDNLKSAKTDDKDMKLLKNRLMQKITDFTNYYRIQNNKVKYLGIQGTKNMAKSIKEWRLYEYYPIKDQINCFIIWSKNQNLFSLAENRIKRIREISGFLNKIDNNDKLSESIEEAQKKFEESRSLNNSAKWAIINFNPSGDALNMIRGSLNYLSDVYKIFFDINNFSIGK